MQAEASFEDFDFEDFADFEDAAFGLAGVLAVKLGAEVADAAGGLEAGGVVVEPLAAGGLAANAALVPSRAVSARAEKSFMAVT